MRFRSVLLLLGLLSAIGCDTPTLEPFGPGNNPPAPAALDARVDVDGVHLSWPAVEEAGDYSIYRARGNATPIKIATSSDTSYADTAIALGILYSYRITTRDGHGTEGASVEIASVAAGYYGLEINGGAAATRASRVQLTPLAPGAVTIAAMGIGDSAAAALDAAPVPFGGDLSWQLSGEDGPKTIHAVHYTDSGAHSDVLSAQIYLDRSAEILDIEWCVLQEGGGCVPQDTVFVDDGDVVRFRVLTGETVSPGTVEVRIGNFDVEHVPLIDIDGDGLYEGLFNAGLTGLRTSETTGKVTAYLTDAVGNEARPAQAPDPIVIR